MALKPRTHLPTSILFAKIATATFLLLSLAALAAKLAVPSARSFLAATLPSAKASLRAYLAPPYLFVTVNLIILTIWKLSERANPSNGPPPTSPIAPPKPKPPPPQPEKEKETPPPPAAEETATLSMDATWKKIGSEMRRAETFRERRPPAPAVRRSETFREGRPELLQMGDDELKRQFEAFIKKVNDQMRVPSPRPPPPQKLAAHQEPMWEHY